MFLKSLAVKRSAHLWTSTGSCKKLMLQGAELESASNLQYSYVVGKGANSISEHYAYI